MNGLAAKERLRWRPSIGLGPIEFGALLPQKLEGTQLTEIDQEKLVGTNRQQFEIEGAEATVFAHYGRIAFVHCWREIYHGSENLIGQKPQDVRKAIEARWVEPIDLGDGEIRHSCLPKGLVLWESRGRVSSVVVYKPHLWDWIPNVRLGEIHFGQLLPKSADLEFRKNEKESDELDDRFDVVTCSIQVDVDPKTRLVTGFIADDYVQYKNRELIGLSIDEVMQFLGGDWDSQGTEDSGQFENDKLGAVLWGDGGKPERLLAMLLYDGSEPES